MGPAKTPTRYVGRANDGSGTVVAKDQPVTQWRIVTASDNDSSIVFIRPSSGRTDSDTDSTGKDSQGDKEDTEYLQVDSANRLMIQKGDSANEVKWKLIQCDGGSEEQSDDGGSETKSESNPVRIQQNGTNLYWQLHKAENEVLVKSENNPTKSSHTAADTGSTCNLWAAWHVNNESADLRLETNV